MRKHLAADFAAKRLFACVSARVGFQVTRMCKRLAASHAGEKPIAGVNNSVSV